VLSVRRRRLVPMPKERRALGPAVVPFWLQPESSLGWSMITTFSESSPGLTVPSSLAPLRLLLADTAAPHGLAASPKAVGSLSEGSRRRVTLSPFFVGYCRWDGRSSQRSSCRTIIPATSRRNRAPRGGRRPSQAGLRPCARDAQGRERMRPGSRALRIWRRRRRGFRSAPRIPARRRRSG
jgi:hypothetical protein